MSEIPDEEHAAAHSSVQAEVPSKLVIDEAQAIGPAGQMSATDGGVVMINRSDDVQIAKRVLLSRSSHPERSRFSAIFRG